MVDNFSPSHPGYEDKLRLGLDRWATIEIDESMEVSKAVDLWLGYPEIEIAEPVYEPCATFVPNDNRYPRQWHHNNTGANPNVPVGTAGADIGSESAWDIEKGNILVAVPDQEIEWFHPDLVNNMWQNLGEDADQDGTVLEWSTVNNRYIFDSGDINNSDDDGNGYEDDFIGWNFRMEMNDPSSFSQSSAHGTWTNGTLVAEGNNSFGVSGVCPECKVIGVTVYYPEQGILYAIDQGAKIISISWLMSSSALFTDIVEYAESQDSLVIVAAGNGNKQNEATACYLDSVICVAATDNFDRASSFTSHGPAVDVAAPGDFIWTTDINGGYKYVGGTSLSTPIVSGVAALVMSAHPSLSLREIRSILQNAVDPIVAPDRFIGQGRINALTALTMAETAVGHGSFPESYITTSPDNGRDVDSIEIRGTATSPDFDHYELWYGSDLYSENLQLLYSAETPVVDGLLYDWSGLPSGNYFLELRTYDTNGQVAIDQLYPLKWGSEVAIDDNFGLYTGSLFQLQGNATSIDFVKYRIQVGLGENPTTWLRDVEYFNPIHDGTLDSFLVTGLPLGSYTIRLTLTDMVEGEMTTEVNGFNVSINRRGWPTASLIGDIDSSPVVVDVDGNGISEIIVASANGYMHVYDGDGIPLSGWPQSADNTAIVASPTVADIDNDGHLEIVAGTINGSLYAWNHDGSRVSGWPKTIGLPITSSVIIKNLNLDKNLEMLVVAGNTVAIRTLNNQLVSGWPINLGSSNPTAAPAVGDIDSDGLPEIILMTDQGLLAWNHDGTVMTGWPKTAINGISGSGVVLADLDRNGSLEVIAGDSNGYLHRVFANGQEYDGWPIAVRSGVAISTTPAVGDVDADGKLDVALQIGDQMYVIDNNGSSLPGWPAMTQPFGSLLPQSSAALADIDGDAELEVISGALSAVFAWDADGSLLPYWPRYTGDRLDSSVAIGDLDANNRLEVVIGSDDNKIHVWNTEYQTSGISGWSMYGHDIRHSNDESTVWCNILTFVNECAAQKPLYCNQTKQLVSHCSYCGCKPGLSCRQSSQQCSLPAPKYPLHELVK